MTIAKYLPSATELPLWATDTNFSGGPDVGTPTKVAPSSGQVAEGFRPDSEPPAQWMNHILHAVSKHVAPTSGWFCHNWVPGTTIPGSFLGLGGAYPALAAASQAPVAVLMSAASGGRPVAVAVNGSGYMSRMYHETLTDTPNAPYASLAGATISGIDGAVFGGLPTVAVVVGGGDVHKTTDLGVNWTTAGNVGATGTHRLHFFPATGVWVASNGETERMRYSSDLSSWSNGTGAGLAPTTCRAFAHSSTAVIAIYGTSSSVCARSVDGAAWTLPSLGATKFWRGVGWNASTGAWLAVADDGTGAKSLDDGLSWSAITVPVGALDVRGFGRWFVAIGSTAINSQNYTWIACSEDNGATWAEFLIDGDATFNRLLEFDGRLMACGHDSFLQIKTLFSLRAPWMPTP